MDWRYSHFFFNAPIFVSSKWYNTISETGMFPILSVSLKYRIHRGLCGAFSWTSHWTWTLECISGRETTRPNFGNDLSWIAMYMSSCKSSDFELQSLMFQQRAIERYNSLHSKKLPSKSIHYVENVPTYRYVDRNYMLKIHRKHSYTWLMKWKDSKWVY